MPAGADVVIESRHDDDALARHKANIRIENFEIEKMCSKWRSEQYRKKLGLIDDGTEDPQQPDANSSSQLTPATPSGPTLRRRPSLVVRQDDERHQRTLAPPDLAPPEIVQRGDLEDEGLFKGTIGALCIDNSPLNRSAIFSAAGLGDYRLTPQEAACSRKTPDISWRTFSNFFGGNLHSERPMGRRIPGYNTGGFLCTSTVTQPFAPTRIGEPGAILFVPGATLFEDTRETFQVLVDSSVRKTKTKLRYCGVYTKVRTPYMEVQTDEWYALPNLCRHKLLEQLQASKVDDIHARCTLRKRLGSAPSPAQIQEWIRKYHQKSEEMEFGALQDAFKAGVEKLGFEMIRCVGYDMKLAKLIRKETGRRSYVH